MERPNLIWHTNLAGVEEFIYVKLLHLITRADTERSFFNFKLQLAYITDEFKLTFPLRQLPIHFLFLSSLTRLPSEEVVDDVIRICSCRMCRYFNACITRRSERHITRILRQTEQ